MGRKSRGIIGAQRKTDLRTGGRNQGGGDAKMTGDLMPGHYWIVADLHQRGTLALQEGPTITNPTGTPSDLWGWITVASASVVLETIITFTVMRKRD